MDEKLMKLEEIMKEWQKTAWRYLYNALNTDKGAYLQTKVEEYRTGLVTTSELTDAIFDMVIDFAYIDFLKTYLTQWGIVGHYCYANDKDFHEVQGRIFSGVDGNEHLVFIVEDEVYTAWATKELLASMTLKALDPLKLDKYTKLIAFDPAFHNAVLVNVGVIHIPDLVHIASKYTQITGNVVCTEKQMEEEYNG
jgi:hypothetical protein